MVAVYEHELLCDVCVVAREVEVPPDGLVVAACLPLAPLKHDGHVRREQWKPAGVVEVQVGQDDPRDCFEVQLVGDARVLLELEAVKRLGLVVRSRVACGARVQSCVDEGCARR